MPIHILAPDIAAKIAAGEVVERPANVVKELLENSLDAGATEIRVEIRDGGERLLRVTDNGHGIAAADAPLAFERHATSKLQSAEDLNHIGTFGFRGEALYSIAAVSQMTLTTRSNAEAFGIQLRVEGGQLVHQGKAGAPVGTVVSVEHLFYNVPARKKFLRKAATEAGAIAAVVQHCALAYPDRRFSLVNDGRQIFQSTGSGHLLDVLTKIYGLENARQMAPVGMARGRSGAAGQDADLADEVDFMAGAPAHAPDMPSPIRVSGYSSLPSLTRANRGAIDLFVNRRYIEDRNLTHAVVQAYHTLLPVGRYPIATILIELDPALVDVNVHPQKTQVRFVEDRAIFSTVQRVVRRAIVDSAGVPSMGFVTGSTGAPMQENGKPDTFPARGNWQESWAARRTSLLNAGPPRYIAPDQSPLEFSTPAQGEQTSDFPIQETPEQGALVQESTEQPSAGQVAEEPWPVVSEERAPVAGAPQTAPTSPIPSGRTAQLPPLRVVGQVGAMYIIAEGPEGLYLIDQHAAHERILYEKFMAQRYGTDQGAVARQQLLEPLPLHTGHAVTGLVAQHLKELRQVGFEIEPFGGDSFLLRAVPSVLADQDPARTLDEIVSALAQQRNLVGEELENRLVKMVCKRAAIKGGQLLSVLEMQELVRQLESCQSPRTCPHGRPTMIQLSAGELEKAFGRL
jgi:DNA mismatch repair protein MutL